MKPCKLSKLREPSVALCPPLLWISRAFCNVMASNIYLSTSIDVHPQTSIHQRLSIDVRPSLFILIDASYSSNYMYYVHTYQISYSSNHI